MATRRNCAKETAEAAAPTSGKARASFVLGILGALWFTAVLALVLGYRARAEIRRSQGQLAGEELARTGIILGWVYAPALTLALIGLLAIALPNVGRMGDTMTESNAVGHLRLLMNCAFTYEKTYGTFPSSLSEMESGREGCPDEAAAGGRLPNYLLVYNSLRGAGGTVAGFSVQAVPVECHPGAGAFYGDQTGTLRVERSTELDCPVATALSPPLR